MLFLRETCFACPEQYDAYDHENNLVGYLRLRHGHFRAHIDGSTGCIVYESEPRGDGRFIDENERREQLTLAVAAIESALVARRGIATNYVIIQE